MEAVNYSEMLVPTYKTTWRHIPEDHNLDTLWCLWMANDYDHLSLYDFPCSDCTASNERTVVDDRSCKKCGSNSLWPVLHYYPTTLMYWVAPQQI